MSHAVPAALCALLAIGCYRQHGLELECELPLGHVCCADGVQVSPTLGSCPSSCPPGAGLVRRDSCRAPSTDGGDPRPDSGGGRDSGRRDAGVDSGTLMECALQRSDFTCLSSFVAPAGTPFSLPTTFDDCVCCPRVECEVRVDEERRVLQLTTGMCADPCDCDGCNFASVDCPVPPLEQGVWSVVVNDVPAFELPVLFDSGLVPPPPACIRYAEPDRCGTGDMIRSVPTRPTSTCAEHAPDGSVRLRVRHDCWDCHDLEGPCFVALEPRLTDDLPPGGELRVLSTSHQTECDVDCPGVCFPGERTCPTPPLTPGHFYRVWREDELLTTFTAGSLPPCAVDPAPG